MKDIIIAGAGGLGQELVWLIEEINQVEETWNILGFLDDLESENEVFGYPILGKYEDFSRFPECHFIVAFGDALLRKMVVEQMNRSSVNWATLISPTVWVHPSNRIGKGVVIGRYTDLTVNCVIHDYSMLNIHVVLGHKVEVGKYSIISPNVTVNGGGVIGEACQVGANAYIKNIYVGDNSIIGASACVLKDVEPNTIVGGVPARLLKKGRPNKSISGLEL